MTPRSRDAGSGRLLVVPAADARLLRPEGALEFGAVKHWICDGSYFRRLRSFDVVEMRVYSLPAVGRLLPSIALLPPLARGYCGIRDEDGIDQPIDTVYLRRLLWELARDLAEAPFIAARTVRRLAVLSQARSGVRLDLSRPPLYVRTDLTFGLVSGGSVGHIAGVVNSLEDAGSKTVFVTTDPIPTVRNSVETHVLRPDAKYRNLTELRMAALTESMVPRVEQLLGERMPSFVYQRYSLNNYAGLALSRRYAVPLVLEYNGSEVWVARNWDKPLHHERLAQQMEMANLCGAELVVVVSRPLRDELVGRGVDGDKILVNPNGVDTEVYSPRVDGALVRLKLGLNDKTVIGFIGTFGPWHGAEMLAEAFGRLVERMPEARESLRLLMVGDGAMMPEVVANLEHHGANDIAVLTGLVPQAEGPAYLAACDVLASPHVPNVDGTPFFGSPTKLFEYMAMGKAIVASDLDQISEVLEDGRTAVMVPPADADALAVGLERLVRSPDLRARLGAAARKDAVAKHTWREHTQRILEALTERCEGAKS